MSTNEFRESLRNIVDAISACTLQGDIENRRTVVALLHSAKALLARPEPDTKLLDEVAGLLEVEDEHGKVMRRFAQWIRLDSGYWAMRIKLEPSPRITREEAAKLLFNRDIALRNFCSTHEPTDYQRKALDDANCAVLAAMGVEL